MRKIGIFLARMQPAHKAHLYVIELMLKECDQVLIVLGSSNKSDTLRNPFSYELRKKLLLYSLFELPNFDIRKISIVNLPDWSSEGDLKNVKEWGSYLYYNIVRRIEQKTFSIYYSDDPSIITNWFEPKILDRITLRLLDRSSILEGLSATKIREAFEKNDKEYIKKYCPKAVFDKFEELKKIWIKTKENPSDDFAMK